MKQVISLTLTISMLLLGTFVFFEPQITKADEDEITVTQGVTAEISIDAAAHVDMAGDIAGITGGSATGETTWTVISNSDSGFLMTLQASADPALVLASPADSFADYTEGTTTVPDLAWSVAESDAEFGYTVFPATPADADPSFKDNGSLCNVATNNPDGTKCWIGFEGATPETIINRGTPTGFAGEAEHVHFKAELNGPATDADGFLAQGNYVATITATATVQ